MPCELASCERTKISQEDTCQCNSLALALALTLIQYCTFSPSELQHHDNNEDTFSQANSMPCLFAGIPYRTSLKSEISKLHGGEQSILPIFS